MAKRAVLIGINYPGTKAELKGCINDVRRMHSCLMQRYGFKKEDMTMLIDTDPTYTQPTGVNIRRALQQLVSSAKPRDELFVHYSGHGTRLPAETGDVDDTGFDECIVPCDMNLITDEDFKELVCQVHDGCRITIVSDSCHSGGLISGAKEQIGESSTIHHRDGDHATPLQVKDGARDTFEGPEPAIIDEDQYQGNPASVKSRSLPLSTLIDMLKETTGNDDIAVGKIRSTLFDIFGDDASPKVKEFMTITSNIVDIQVGEQGSSSREILAAEGIGTDDTKLAPKTEGESTEQVNAGTTKRVLPSNGILLSGCQTDETSADANPTGDPSEAYGAFTNAILSILKDSKKDINNYQIVLKARKLLKRQGFTQRPGLYCSDDYAKAGFLY